MRGLRAVGVLFAVGATLSFAFGTSGASAAAGNQVVALRLEGVVDPFEADYVAAGIQAASDEGATAVLLTIDTPGGLDSSMRKITQAILNSPVPVITYVSPEGARAASAGTFILLAGSVAAMAPSTNVGAAHPVGVSGVIESRKVLNDAVATIKGIAEARGRNAHWAEQAVRNSVSIPAERALQLNVIDLIEPDTGALLEALNGRSVPVAHDQTVTLHTTGASVVDRNLGFVAGLLHGLLSPDLAFIFFYLGIGLIVLEFIHPGIGLAAVFGVLSLAASFVSFGVLPFQIIGALLLVGSVVSFLLELKAPGVGVFTAIGVILLVAGALTLFDPSVPNARVSWWVIVPVAALAAGFFGLILGALVQARHLPVQMRSTNLIGRVGVVTTALTPLGNVHVSSETWSAVSTSGPVPAGTRVVVVDVDGLRLKVSPASAGDGGTAIPDADVPVSERARQPARAGDESTGSRERAESRPTST
jgi:membrane-bound serine protease (ClpP class)